MVLGPLQNGNASDRLGRCHRWSFGRTGAISWTAAKLSGGDGLDHVVEVGGAGTLSHSIRACRFGGKIELIGILAGREVATEVFPIVSKGAAIFGIYVGSREMFENLNRALEQSRIKPVIDRVFPFESVPEAYKYLESGSHFGKIVIRIGDQSWRSSVGFDEPAFGGYSPAFLERQRSLEVEQPIRNRQVMGSIPIVGSSS
jgi:Zn-dependent alcohol dehydrogenase